MNYKTLNDYEIMYMVSEKDDDAYELLFKKYKPLVEKLALKKYSKAKKSGIELEDLIQEGYYGLSLAVKNYTDKMNCLFYTYASICINSKMNNMITANSTIKNMTLNTSISFDAETNDGIRLIDHISDSNALLPDVEYELNEIRDGLKDMIYKLPIDEASTLELYYNGFRYPEIMNLLDVSYYSVNKRLSRIKKLLVKVEKKVY